MSSTVQFHRNKWQITIIFICNLLSKWLTCTDLVAAETAFYLSVISDIFVGFTQPIASKLGQKQTKCLLVLLNQSGTVGALFQS